MLPLTPVRILPPEGPGGTQTPRQSLPNTSASPYRRKRTYSQTLPQVPAPPPVLPVKPAIQEEVGKLQAAIEAGRLISSSLSYDDEHIELEDSSHHPQAEDPYQQCHGEFTQTLEIPLPASLFDKHREALHRNPEIKLACGLLCNIHRVWFGLGKVLYLWDYETGALVEAAELTDIVVSVVIVPRNSDIFTSKVQYMLLVTTPIAIFLYGVDPLCRLLPTDVSIPSNEENFHQFAFLPTGRIFMGGAEGSISELRYGNTSWFSSGKRYKRENCGARSVSSLLPRFLRFFTSVQVIQLSADPSRYLLYVLVAKANRTSEYRIDIYDMGPQGDYMQRKVCIQAHTFIKRVKEHTPRLVNVPNDRLSVVALEAVSRRLSVDYHALVLTRNGIRIYLSLHLSPLDPSSATDILHMRPSGDFSISLKFPPVAVKSQENAISRNQTVNATADKPSNYEHCLMLSDGTVVLLDTREALCKIVTIRRSLHRISLVQEHPNKPILEPEENVCCLEELKTDKIQAVSEVDFQAKMTKDLAELCGVVPRGEFMKWPETRWIGGAGLSLHCQTSLSNFLYLPSARFQILTGDQLVEFTEVRPIDVLVDIMEKEDGKETEKLRDLGETYGLTQVCSWLVAVAAAVGGGQGKQRPKDALIYMAISEKARYRAKLAFTRMSTAPQAVPVSSRMQVTEELTTPLDQKAVSLHLSRVLRPIWLERVSYYEEDPSVQVEHFSTRHYDLVTTPLRGLLSFLEDTYRDRIDPQTVNSKDGIVDIVMLIRRCLQAVSLLTTLSVHYNFRRVVNELPETEQALLATLTVQDLVASRVGQDLAKSLIEAYVRQVSEVRLGKGIRVKLEDMLREFTMAVPAYFTEADAEIHVAAEALLRARNELEVERRRDYVTVAMAKLTRNAASISMPRILPELLGIGEVLHAVSLCLHKAKSLLAVTGSEVSAADINECYVNIFTILTDIQQCILSEAPDQVEYLSSLSLESLLRLRHDLLLECVQVTDQQLHWTLFTWLVRWDLSKLILQLESPFILPFLEQKLPPEKFPAVSLIADYCMKMKEYRRAYLEYGRLAELRQEYEQSTDVIPLSRRTELLDLSLLCLDGLLSEQRQGSSDIQPLTKAREGLLFNQRLCSIQQRLQRDLIHSQLLPEAETLNRRLFTAEEMYERYAKPFDLFETQLELLNFIYSNSAGQQNAIKETMKSLIVEVVMRVGMALWPQKIREKMEELGRKYPYAFPMDTLTLKCEQTNLQLSVESPWVVQLLTTLPLPQDFADLYQVYSGLWSAHSTDLAAQWTLVLKLECLFRLWLEAAERCIGSSLSVWSNATGLKASRERLISQLPAIFNLIESVFRSVMEFPLERQRRVEPSFLDIRDRFLKVEGLLQVKASARRPDPALSESRQSAQSHNFSLLAPKALSFKETPQRSPQASPKRE